MKHIKLFEAFLNANGELKDFNLEEETISDDPFGEDGKKYSIGDTLICTKTFGVALMPVTPDKHFYIEGNGYKIVEIDDIGYTMSFYGEDRNGTTRDIVDFYPLKEYELELYFVKK